MADTAAMAPPPSMGEPPQSSMSMTEAMDVLDEFHIKRSDYDRVMSAIEAVMGPGDEAEPMDDADNAEGAGDADMAQEVFDPARNRKAM